MDHNFLHYISFSSESDGKKRRTRLKIDTEDIIAVFAGVIAIMFSVAMIAGWLPVDKYTVSLASLSAAGVAIAQITKARRGRAPQKPKAKTKKKKL